MVTLACMVLQNICISTKLIPFQEKLDFTVDPSTQEKWDREEIRKLLQMKKGRISKDSYVEAVKVRDAHRKKLENF